MEGCEGPGLEFMVGGGWARLCRECPLPCTSDAWMMAKAVLCSPGMRLCSWRPRPLPSDLILGSASVQLFSQAGTGSGTRAPPRLKPCWPPHPSWNLSHFALPPVTLVVESQRQPSGAGGQWESPNHRVPSTFSPGSPILTGGGLGGDHKN